MTALHKKYIIAMIAGQLSTFWLQIYVKTSDFQNLQSSHTILMSQQAVFLGLKAEEAAEGAGGAAAADGREERDGAWVAEGGQTGKIVGAEPLQKVMELGAVVVMAQVGELVEKDIIADGLGKADKIEIEIDVAKGGAAAPVGGIVLDGHAIVAEAVSFGKETELDGEQGAGLIAEYLH